MSILMVNHTHTHRGLMVTYEPRITEIVLHIPKNDLREVFMCFAREKAKHKGEILSGGVPDPPLCGRRCITVYLCAASEMTALRA